MNRFFIIILSIFFLFNCSSNEQTIDDFSSPKSLFVDHISSFTGGVISVGNNIRLKLTKSIPDSLVGSSLNDIFDFSPNIEGTATWEDNKTIVFQPSTNLSNNQKYEATVNLKSIIPEIDNDKKEFRFVFQTLIQNYEIAIGGLKLYDSKNLTKVKIEGIIQTADIVDFENLKKTLSASQAGESLNITWENPNRDNKYNFIVENVKRGDSEGKVKLTTNGSPIKVKKEETLEVEIPSLSDYKVISSRIVRGEDNFISVLFSDPLDARQNLSGMVSLSGTNSKHRLVISLNELKIYPTSEITSEAVLTINIGVKNIAGYKLKEEYITTLQFTQIKPEVRMVDANAKSILPNSNGIVLPFEAIGLEAVDVTVIRIFEDNMQQYLQVNGLGGQNQLSRVGRPIVKKTVPLNTSGVTNLNAWNRFTLNLEDILTTEPGAFYQIQIGFQKRHSLYFCSNNDQIESIEDELDEWGAEEEGSYWDNYEYYKNLINCSRPMVSMLLK